MVFSELDIWLFGINALAYILLFAWFWHQDRTLNLRTFITLLYAGSAICSPYVYHAIDEHFYNGVQIDHLTFWPFVYLFAMYLLVLRPLLRDNVQEIKHVDILNPRLLNVLTWVIAGIYAVTIIFSSMHIADLFSLEKLMQNYADTINNTIDGFKVDVGPIERYTSILKGAMADITILLLAYHILTNQKAGIIAMALCMGYDMLYSLSIGQRAAILEIILSIGFIFLVTRHAMEERTRRRFSIALIAFGSVAVIAFGALTFARFSERDNSVADYVLTYYSESWYIFNNHGLDPGGCRYGDFTAPLARRLLGKPCTQTMFESIDNFPSMRTNCSVFNTVVGDFTMDFGAIWTVVILLIYATLMHVALRDADKENFPISKLIIVIIAWRIASMGFIAYSYRGIAGNLQIVTDILFYLLLRNRYVLKR